MFAVHDSESALSFEHQKVEFKEKRRTLGRQSYEWAENMFILIGPWTSFTFNVREVHIFKSHYLYYTQQTVSCGVAPKIIRHRIQGRQRQSIERTVREGVDCSIFCPILKFSAALRALWYLPQADPTAALSYIDRHCYTRKGKNMQRNDKDTSTLPHAITFLNTG